MSTNVALERELARVQSRLVEAEDQRREAMAESERLRSMLTSPDATPRRGGK